MHLTPLLWLGLQLAHATEVVWLEPPSDADRDLVADQAGATRGPLEPIDLRAAATAWSDTDQQAYDALEAALADARTYEKKLDGELVIMRDLAAPLENITIIRNENDRSNVYAALAYQGFAVNRFFGEGLADDEQAAPYRVDLNGVVVERPWMDAVALDPEREVTPYDIAEAPQRVAYGKVAEVVNQALPASLSPSGLPDGAKLIVDGRETPVGPAGNIKLVPGRHLVHIALDGRVIARWAVDLSAGAAKEMGPELDDDAWMSFLSGLADGGEVPAGLAPALKAMGGEVWIARPSDKEPEVFAVRADGMSAVAIERPKPEREGNRKVSLVLGVHSGWFYSGDFYKQRYDEVEHNDEAVNASSLSMLTVGELGSGILAISAGVQTWYTLGEDHFALVDDKRYRVRPYFHLGMGLKYLQVTGGYLLPYHPAAGARAAIPLVGPLELHGSGILGFKGTLDREDSDTNYKSEMIRSVQGGLGLRF